MSDLADEIRNLREKTSRNRREFLRTEVETCSLTLEMGNAALERGNLDMAKQEVSIAQRGIATIERFLEEAPEARTEIAPRVSELKELLASLEAAVRAM